jgi:hypothetical protein
VTLAPQEGDVSLAAPEFRQLHEWQLQTLRLISASGRVSLLHRATGKPIDNRGRS